MSQKQKTIKKLNQIIRETEEEIEKLCSEWDIFDKQDFFHSTISIYDSLFIQFAQKYQEGNRPFEYILLQYGYPVFIRKFYTSEFETLPGVALRAIDNEKMIIYSKITYACGIIGWIQHFVDNINAGQLSGYSWGTFIRIKFTNKYHWNEYLEREYIDWYSKMVAEFQRNDYIELDKKLSNIITKLEKSVFIWCEQFLGYTNDMETEEFFWKHAFLDLQQTVSWDSFPPNCKFGDLYYCDIVNSIIDFAGYAIKHIYCASTLKKNKPDLIFENLLKYAFTRDLALKLIMENREVSKQQAEEILSLISLDSSNIEYYCNSGAKRATSLKISAHQYIRSICGLLQDPLDFVLYNLRKRYKSDWDKNVNLREHIFRKQLYDIFEAKDFMCINRPIVIAKSGQKLADIDATILDRKSGEIAFFQLKWQDPFEYSPFTLNSKGSNFLEQTSSWIDSVKFWINETSEDLIASVLGVKAKFIKKDKIKLFVLGRTHANYSGNSLPNSECAWCQWYQLLAIKSHLKQKDEFTLDRIYETIQNTAPQSVRIIEPKNKFVFGKYRILFGG